jgi:hypothetical protein
LVLFAAILAGRMLWEETFLTMQQGPQMLGFSLARGGGAVLFLAPFLLALWLLVALVMTAVCLWRKRLLSWTVRGYLEHGVPLKATNYEGSTAAFAAAVGGSLPMIKMLVSKGADLDTANSYGDSPLEAAVETRHTDVAAFLKAHGASQIRGTPEQRQAASAAIVRRDIERSKGR